MDSQHEQDALGVAEAIRTMSDEEVRLLVDETYASGMVQTLQDVTRVLANA